MTMSSFGITFVILCVIMGGITLGLVIGRYLPAHHLSGEAKSTVSVSMAVVGTMTALVIGLLISTANTSYKARNADVSTLSSNIIRLDATLRRYGPQTQPARAALQQYAKMTYEDLFASGPSGKANVNNPATLMLLDDVQDKILALKSNDNREKWLSAQALQLAAGVGDASAVLIQQEESSIPLPFLAAVVFWMTILFASFALFAPRNITVIIALLLCAFSASAAFKLVLDMDTPFDGKITFAPPPIRISNAPIRHAIQALQDANR
jgi:hypothetical protein